MQLTGMVVSISADAILTLEWVRKYTMLYLRDQNQQA